MFLKVKDIGLVKEATIDVDNKLILFCGPNNTGKTYISYCIYLLSKSISFSRNIDYSEIFDSDFNLLFSEGKLDINLFEITNNEAKRNLLIKELKKSYKDFLPNLFGIDSEFFSNSELLLEFGIDNTNFSDYFKSSQFSIGGYGFGQNQNITLSKNTQNGIITIELQQGFNQNLSNIHSKEFIIKTLQSGILQYSFNMFSSGFFLPAERIGISIFSKELFLNRFASTNEIMSLDAPNRTRILDVFNQRFNRYSLVIQDAIRNQENLSIFIKSKKQKTKFTDLADELETKILKGNLSVTDDGDVFFNYGHNALKIQASGSIVKSLSSLVFYLRYQAQENQLLIIDEPESNLHPDNQILVARILAKLSNMKVKVVISTHSDYIIREFNNLIMLNKKTNQTNDLIDKYKYEETEILNYNDVGVHFFNDGIVENIKASETGFEIPTIDNTILLQNSATNEIRWTLFDE